MKLPLNCEVEYLDDFLTEEEANALYQNLIEHYQLDKARISIEAGGKWIETDGFKILFATEDLIRKNTHPEHVHGKVHPWGGIMAELRDKVEEHTKQEFELAMCLYYPDGNFFAPYHSDQQTSGHKTILPSLSLGETRQFSFKEIDGPGKYSLDLSNGSLLVMGDHCQNRYTHSLPKNPIYTKGRINITFREPEFK